MNNIFHPRSFQVKILLLSLILTLTLAIIFLTIFQTNNRNAAIRIQANFSTNSFNQADKNLSIYFDKLSQNAYEALNDPRLAEITKQNLNASMFSNVRTAVSTLDSVMNEHLSLDYISDTYFFSINDFSYHRVSGYSGNYLSDEYKFAPFQSWYTQTIGTALLQPLSLQAQSYNPDLQAIFNHWQNQPVFFDELRVSGEIKGILVLKLDPQLFSDFIRQPLNGENLFVLNADNQVLYKTSDSVSPPDTGIIAQSYQSVGKSMVLSYPSRFNELRFISSFDPHSRYLLLRQNTLDIWTLIIALSLLGILFMVANYFARKLTNPILEVIRPLKRDLSAQFPMPKIAFPKLFLRQKILMYLFLTTFIPNTFLVGYLTYTDYNAYESKLEELQSYTIDIVLQSIEYPLRNIEQSSRDIFSNEDIQNELIASESDRENNPLHESSVISLDSIRSGIISAAIIDLKGNPIYSTTYFDTHALKIVNSSFDFLPLNNGKLQYIPQSSEAPRSSSYFNFVRRVSGIDGSHFNKTIGYLLIQIDKESFNRILDGLNIGSHGELYLFDDISGDLLVQTNESTNNLSDANAVLNTVREAVTYPNTQNAKLYYSKKTKLNNFRLVTVTSLSEIREQVLSYLKNFLYLFALFTLLIFIFSTTISRGVTKPIRLLMSATHKIQDGDLKVSVPPRGRDELAVLTQHFNHMIVRINELIEENYRSKMRENELMFLEKEAQFKALQQQINPHFLYNTLESIKWMAYKHGLLEISNMASALGKFFRGSISSSSDLISIAKEVEHLQSYIYIQKIRYQQKFEVELLIEDQIMPLSIIRLILQPIVENSILHGLDPIEENGLLQILGYLHEDTICFSIKDNGVGMEEEKLEEVRLKILSPFSNESIGLSNVYRRLQLYFDNDIQFDIESAVNEGTEIRFSYPANRSTIS
ncbi:sensor histidine kinase YesM [Fontibacillus solani]|uniref:Sensor histidine kinase YesM n=1 Tax=Fontibacillus solani TaxID=1572857 RepID=A0A7W3XTK1_9BACL|nr:sensor histidine kinase [Fontibacillus solani]MBA9087695.1 sensor histidine kinase YesM [Fontibacillus solani]